MCGLEGYGFGNFWSENGYISELPRKITKHQSFLGYKEKCFHFFILERFSYDLEMKTCEQNRNNKRTEIERFDWCMKRIQTHLAFDWLSERSGKQTSCAKNFLEIALTSYCNTIGQSNNAFSILGLLGGKTKRPCFDLFIHWLMKQRTNTHRNLFSRSHENRSMVNVLYLPFSSSTAKHR